MILKDSEALARLNSPMNLFNRMRSSIDRKNNGLSLFVPKDDSSKEVVSQSKPSGFINPFDKKTEETITVTIPIIDKQEASISADDILPDNSDYDIKLQEAHNKAVNVLHRSLEQLESKVPELGAAKLAQVARQASQIVDTIRKEKLERAKINSGKEVHFHFYQPEQKKLEDYQVIEVG